MKISLFLVFVLAISGCSNLSSDPLFEPNEVAQGTSETDAVEGTIEQDSAGIIGKLRSRKDAVPGDPNWSPLEPVQKPEHFVAATGSLFSVAGAQDLYDDTRPRDIGDILTVMLEEETQAKKTASNDTKKSSDLSMDPLEFGGKEIKIGDANLSYAMSNDNKTSGTSSADQSNSINGSISVEVIEVLSNGNLVVRGEKWLTLNTGEEYIRISGIIRPEDITPENTVPSTRISNARIQYSGTGDRQDIQEQGWLARFFNVLL